MVERALDQGYASGAYAAALSEFGTPRALPACGGWALERPTPDGGTRDACGCYPLFCCRDWGRLQQDMEGLRESGLVCFSAVLDPFGDHDAALRERCFPDRLAAFKEHFVTDLTIGSGETAYTTHHRRDARRCLRHLRTEVCGQPSDLLDGWCGLYGQLRDRHNIAGIAAFSRESFAAQLAVPGLTVFTAWQGPELAAMTLWYRMGEVAYYHLNACSETGYRRSAAYGLMWAALEYWRAAGVRWAALGAGSGLEDGEGGLQFFKRGWATGTRTAWFGGAVFRPDIYQRLCGDSPDRAFFPAYRAPEPVRNAEE